MHSMQAPLASRWELSSLTATSPDLQPTSSERSSKACPKERCHCAPIRAHHQLDIRSSLHAWKACRNKTTLANDPATSATCARHFALRKDGSATAVPRSRLKITSP